LAPDRGYAEVAEGVRAAIAEYTQALDDGRTDELVDTFCPDGWCDMPGLGRHEGHEALRDVYSKWTPSLPQRHLVVNTLVSQWNDEEAHATSDFVFILKDQPGWAVQIVGRYHDVLHCVDGRWRFHSRVAEFVK
jgi:hypothetical protein